MASQINGTLTCSLSNTRLRLYDMVFFSIKQPLQCSYFNALTISLVLTTVFTIRSRIFKFGINELAVAEQNIILMKIHVLPSSQFL
jgi:hypothetical protein